MDPDLLVRWFLLAIAIAIGISVAELARAQVPVTVVACSEPHDTCRYSTTAPSESAVEACLQLNAQGWTLDDCGGVYPSCWSYGVGDLDSCAVLPNSPASETDPCYQGCLHAEASACGETVELDCITCRPAYGPSVPRCRTCGRVVEVCFQESLPAPGDANAPGDGQYNPDDPSEPDPFGEEDAEPGFTECDSAVQDCACDYNAGQLSFESNVGNCSGDFNGDGDADTNELVNKKCEDGACRCPDGTTEEAVGGGNACRVVDECMYHADLFGEAANCGCGRLYLYEGECVQGCPSGSSAQGGQCVPEDDETDPDPFEGVLTIGDDLCVVEFPEGGAFDALAGAWDVSFVPSCRRVIGAVQRVFSPTFAASNVCPFSFADLQLTWGGEDIDTYQRASDAGVVCDVLEGVRDDVQNLLGWVYIILAMIIFVRLN